MKDLLPEYLHECRKRGILEARIIHGKGTGMLRETVHAILRRMPEVASFRLADETAGSWGATLVELRRNNNRCEAPVSRQTCLSEQALQQVIGRGAFFLFLGLFPALFP